MTSHKQQAMFSQMRAFVAEARSFGVLFRTFNVASDLEQPEHDGRIVVAYVPVPEMTDFLIMGVSFCSPKDDFSHLKGRGVAAARILSMSAYIVHMAADQTLADTLRRAILDIAQHKSILWMDGLTAEDLL